MLPGTAEVSAEGWDHQDPSSNPIRWGLTAMVGGLGFTSIDGRPPRTVQHNVMFGLGIHTPVVSRQPWRHRDFVVGLQRCVSPAAGKDIVQRHRLVVHHRMSHHGRLGVEACFADDLQKLEVQLLQSILRGANEHNHRPSLLPRAQPHRAADLGTIVTIRHRRATKSFTSSAEHACGVSATAALRCSLYGWGGRCEAIPSSWTHGQPC